MSPARTVPPYVDVALRRSRWSLSVPTRSPPTGCSSPLALATAQARPPAQAAALLAEQGVAARVLDLRWLSPLPLEAVARQSEACGRLLVVDECRATAGGVADALLAGTIERGVTVPMSTVRAADSFVPLGPAADTVLVDTGQVVAAALDLAAR